MTITEKDKKRFVDHFNQSTKQDDCLIWPLAPQSNGYGHHWMRSGSRGAHRVSYEIFNGPIPSGLVVCHSCDNRSCVNPEHLWVGTQQQNLNDMKSKNRDMRVGSKNGRSKLNEVHVKNIKSLLKTNTVSQKELANKYKVSTSVICDIANNNSWRHV